MTNDASILHLQDAQSAQNSRQDLSLLGRLEGLFSAYTRTGSPSTENSPTGSSNITSASSAAPTVQVLLSTQWQERLAGNPLLREALRDALGGIVSGSQSHDEILRDWAGVLGGSATLRLVSGGRVIEVEATPLDIADSLHTPHTGVEQASVHVVEHSDTHARLANELREMTGLGAAKLASALGITREQYSRWANGAPISDTKHGQLRYLHTVIADLVRRVGPTEARVWLQTPIDGQTTPAELLTSRRWSDLHRRVVEVHDVAPVVDGVMVSLLAPLADNQENPEDLEELEQEEAWSPYPPEGKR
ncbi:helix-turn-helix transcriptional regulator [Streptomyces sp. NPDC093544]|uniref:helix-turn-helix domain-containing protein n=1 Tax=Streptomyces sp. NPDC093544 TaxID=3155200 RepID=UPI003433BA8C